MLTGQIWHSAAQLSLNQPVAHARALGNAERRGSAGVAAAAATVLPNGDGEQLGRSGTEDGGDVPVVTKPNQRVT